VAAHGGASLLISFSSFSLNPERNIP
jgi:hypothetical protein